MLQRQLMYLLQLMYQQRLMFQRLIAAQATVALHAIDAVTLIMVMAQDTVCNIMRPIGTNLNAAKLRHLHYPRAVSNESIERPQYTRKALGLSLAWVVLTKEEKIPHLIPLAIVVYLDGSR